MRNQIVAGKQFTKHVPAVVNDRKTRGESGHSRLRQSGVLQLAESHRIPLHSAIRVEERHGDTSIFQRAVVLALRYAQPHFGAMVL